MLTRILFGSCIVSSLLAIMYHLLTGDYFVTFMVILFDLCTWYELGKRQRYDIWK